MSVHWKIPEFDQTARVSADDYLGSKGEIHSFRLPEQGHSGQDKTIRIQFAKTSHQRDSACSLLNRMYEWRGYGSDHRISASEMHTTFTASADSEVVGTLTLAADSPDGLAADKTFPDEVNALRAVPGARVCELTRLAFDAAVPSKPLLAAFFHVIFIYGRKKHGGTDLLIEVNPRHVRFYQVMLGFKRVGPPKMNEGVSAPSQLMWLKVADIRRYIDEHAGKDPATVRSLYPYFFSAREEQGIAGRLAGLIGTELPGGLHHLLRQVDQATMIPTDQVNGLAFS